MTLNILYILPSIGLWGLLFCKLPVSRKLSVMVLKYVDKLFDTPFFKKWGYLPQPCVSTGLTKLSNVPSLPSLQRAFIIINMCSTLSDVCSMSILTFCIFPSISSVFEFNSIFLFQFFYLLNLCFVYRDFSFFVLFLVLVFFFLSVLVMVYLS